MRELVAVCIYYRHWWPVCL